MADDHDPATPEGAAAILDELATRATEPLPGGPAGAVERAEAALNVARQHLHSAHLNDDAGTDIPGGARLRSVKSAVNIGLRPVTSHQVPFNRELVAAVGRLIEGIDELTRVVAAVDIQSRDMLARAATGMATAEMGQATLEEDVARLGDAVADLEVRTTEVAEGLAAQRQATGTARVREDAVLRAARAALAGTGADPAAETPPSSGGRTPADELRPVLAAAADEADAELVAHLIAAIRPVPDSLWAQAHAVAETVAATAGAPVLDLASGRGEWLDAWTALGVEAHGVEADPEAAAALIARGHKVEAAHPLAHLAGRPDGSYGAVTAALLADTIGLDGLIALVDGAARVLRPGGLAVFSAATPRSLAEGSSLWAHPWRRAVHPDLLVALAFARGYAEADVVIPAPAGDDGGDTYLVVARTPGGAPAR